MGLFDLIKPVLSGGKELAEVFTVNKEKQHQREHEENMADMGRDMASLQMFSNEFFQRQNRTWWDSLLDGLNRLPRPLFSIAILGFFMLAPLNPVKFMEIAKALEIIPPGYWALLSIILSFYFGGRMQLKSQDMALKKDAVQAAKELVSMRKSFREINTEGDTTESKIFDNAMESGEKRIKNKVIEEWLRNRG